MLYLSFLSSLASIYQFIGIVLVTFTDKLFVAFVDTISVTLIISSHTITESTTLFNTNKCTRILTIIFFKRTILFTVTLSFIYHYSIFLLELHVALLNLHLQLHENFYECYNFIYSCYHIHYFYVFCFTRNI